MIVRGLGLGRADRALTGRHLALDRGPPLARPGTLVVLADHRALLVGIFLVPDRPGVEGRLVGDALAPRHLAPSGGPPLAVPRTVALVAGDRALDVRVVLIPDRPGVDVTGAGGHCGLRSHGQTHHEQQERDSLHDCTPFNSLPRATLMAAVGENGFNGYDVPQEMYPGRPAYLTLE